MKQNPFMAIALDEARAAAERAEVPVGACLVLKGEVLARNGNRIQEHKNALAHAEMLVIAAGLKKLGQKQLCECDIYITLEPCFMCAGAISLVQIKRLYYGADDKKIDRGGGGGGGGAAFLRSAQCLHRPEIYDGIGAKESATLLREFFQGLRSNQK